MLLLCAGVLQTLLLVELLLRRVLYLLFAAKRSEVQRYADNSVLASLAAAGLQAVTAPLQAVASLLASGARVWAVLLLLTVCFSVLAVMSNSSVYAYSAVVRMYNTGVAPVVGALRWVSVITDFVFRAAVPLWNGISFLVTQILRQVLVPYTFDAVDTLPELLQASALALGTLGQSTITFFQHVQDCTVGYEDVVRVCGANTTRGVDCATVFAPLDLRCHAMPTHLALDLLTPGLFFRQAVQSVQGMVAKSCGIAAVVLNLAMYPLADVHVYAAIHAAVNTVVFTCIGMPVSTWRRCRSLEQRARESPSALRSVHVKVGCTPDWQPVAAMAESALESVGKALDNWLNAAAIVVHERTTGSAFSCEANVPLKQIVLDAARAIEGLESVEALEKLQGRNGAPESETLRSVRVVGLTPMLFGVTDGRSVLYRSAHDGYVLAFGAWPVHVDVRYGLAAVTYGGSATEADSSGAARTGLLGCRCVETPEFSLVCATAPYVHHIDDELAGLNTSSLHSVSFRGLLLSGMTCANTAVRVMPLRWPRRRLATTEGGGSGFTGYDRFSFRDTVARYTGDADATDNLQLLAARERAMPTGAVEAAIYVQPVCGNEKSVACAPTERATCFPWCMGLVRGGRRAQNITMYNARQWEEHVVLPGVDCGVRRDKGTCDALPTGASAPLVDLMDQEGHVRARCAADCTPAPVSTSVMSLVPLDGAERKADANSTLGLVQQHKTVWTSARLEQPVVVAGDAMLTLSTDASGVERLVVTRLFDIGQSTLQMASERLTLASNAHAAEVVSCATQDDVGCVARAMQAGQVVLPSAVRAVHGDVADAGIVLPAAASRWAVHWAQNPEVAVYNNLFEYCRNATPQFSLTVHSSYNRARVWTLQTMRAVDLELEGTPSEQQTRSRVSYMRVPYFLGKQDFNERACGKVVGLQVVGVEYLNEQNVLVTVLAARPRDYNPRTGKVDGPRTHRYYYLHPGRSDCVRADEEDALPENPRIFSCWRSHASGMWPADDLVTGGDWGGKTGGRCTRPRIVPELGTWAVMPAVAFVRIAETSLDAVCTLAAVIAADTQNPVRALDELFTVQLQQSTFHATVDSAGARLLAVDGFIAVADWLAAFNARLASFVVNALTSVSTGQEQVDKTVQGVRTLVVAGAKVYEGMPRLEQPFARIEKMFREPIAYSGLHASVAVLTMADGVKVGVVMPAVVRAFMAAQLQLVSVLALTLRLGRVVLLRLIQSIGVAADGRQNAATSIVSAALLESRSIVQNDYLSIMRFQCYGFAQMAGSEHSWGQALRHMCLLLPDTLEGVLTVGSVLTLEYPVVACACTLGEGDALDSPNEAVVSICLQRPMPAENTQWLLALRFESATRQDVCFAAMDSANVRLYTAFDKSFKRLYQMARHAAQVADGLLALITGDTVACDAFDVSPYVVSIIPEPVDYFSSCVETDDCAVRCLDEYTAFQEERRARQDELPPNDFLGMSTSVDVPLESLLFSIDDIQQGRHKPPFQILDAAEMPPEACGVVCSRSAPAVGTRCVSVAGVHGRDLAVAYYCLPIDITQYVYQWPGMEAFTLPPAGSDKGFAVLVGTVRSVYVASTWAALRGARDSLIAVVDTEDESASDKQFLGTPQRVTRVFWCVPSMPAREIIRTSLLSERRLDAAPSSMLLAKTYMYAIEHVQVDVADSDRAEIAVRAYGFHTQVTRASGAPGWSAPASVCIECVFESDPTLFTSARCEACALDASPVEFVRQHVRLCMRSEPDKMPRERPLPCADALELPTQSDTVAGFVTQAQETHATLRTAAASKLLRVPASTLNVLRNDARNGVYMDLHKKAHARVSIVSSVTYPSASRLAAVRNISANAPSAAVELEVIAVNAQRSQGAWMHVLSLRVHENGINGAQRSWLRSSAPAGVNVNCSVRSCGACAYTTAGNALHSDLRKLENLCYAAQQCGIERCAGTLVNMRKPLCNLGNVLVADLHQVRILLHGLWGAIADNIAMIVELTHERRQLYQIKWPEKLVRQEACTAKDTLVSAAATVTSVFGAFSHLMQDVSLHHGFVGSSVDARVHARYIMVLTAMTNMLSSIFMWPIYQGLVLQKWFSCTTNDLLMKIDTLIGPGNGQISLRFGDPRAAEAIAQAGVAVCMSEDVSQSLQDAGVRVREAGSAGGGGDPAALRVMRKLTDAISSTIDFGLSSYVQYAYHVMDIWLAWGASVLKGMMDVAQTADWENCKLPVVDTGLQSIGMCACGDHEYAVAAVEKRKDWQQQAFWCSGFLLLNAGDGSDLTVWNPYSLQQLLEIKGNQGSGYSDFITCLRERWKSSSPYHMSTCDDFKPIDARLQRQGVEVLQVISRCRSNYQQSRWDEGSALVSLFDAKEWSQMATLSYSSSARKDDKYARLRRMIVHLLDNDQDLRSANFLQLSPGVMECLADAMSAGMLQHNCHKGVTSFVYERPQSVQPAHVDACRVLSGATNGLDFPRFLWSGNSRNHVPLAKLHALQLTDAERVAAADAALQNLLAKIKREFDTMLDTSSLTEELANSVRVESFSPDGDELHQLVDCVIMGPYSAADLNTNVHVDNVAKVPVPQYHRGSADSREFTSNTVTGGSTARKDIMRTVFDFVDSHASAILVREAAKQVAARAQEWLEPDNFKCPCNGGTRSYECCATSSDFVLQRLPQENFDLQESILAATLEHVADSKFLQETVWTRRSGDSIPLRAEHRTALHEAHMFRPAAHMPIRTYSVDDTVTALNEQSLWETCTASVAGMFATLPLTDETVNVEQGRTKSDSRVHVPAAAFQDFDPSVSFATDRIHSMEILVDLLLERSRALTPHFWTHAHRYVASDSVWCERASTQEAEEKQVIKTPASIKGQKLRQEDVLAPGPEELLYPADVLRTCACGWVRNSLCYVPSDVCAQAQGYRGSVWTELCAGGATYAANDKETLLAVLAVLQQLDADVLSGCSARRVSTAWGLLSPAQQHAWYAGARLNWTIDAQHIATAGPAGLRLGMLSPAAAESLEQYVQRFALGETLRGTFHPQYAHTIAQPVCESTLRNHLTDDLRRYFADVFVPMAHSVQIVPSVEYCSRWAIEHAMLHVLQRVKATPQLSLDRQRSVAELWRSRCAAQLHQIALCELRGVFDTVPDGSDVPESLQPSHACAFAGEGHVVTKCTKKYYTSACLIYCDGTFYDPCMCVEDKCAPRPFDPSACARGRIVDGRVMLVNSAATHEVFLTSSLSTPVDVLTAEADNDTHWQQLRSALAASKLSSDLVSIDFHALFAAAADVLTARVDEETLPFGYCDDVLDYWPDVEHPVGYHPSTACTADESRTRGFTAWMSRDDTGKTLIDPVRMRNMTQASQEFGAAHLVCDAHAYAASRHRLNPYYMESRWDSQAHADPAMPAAAPHSTVDEMPTLGKPSYSDTDTTLREQGHTAGRLLQHSVGLVRAWAQWLPRDARASSVAEAAAAQAILDTQWPHWLPEEEQRGAVAEHAGLFLGAREGSASPPAGCSFPRLLRCRHDSDCAQDAQCLLNWFEAENIRRGVCMPAGTCYQHQHCAGDLMCSGEGACVQPTIFVVNEADWDSEIQLFGKQGCEVSMQRVSRFESIPDFARANGMCSFRNWYHFKNVTAGAASHVQGLLSVADRLVLRTDKADAQTLESLSVLKTLGQPCDRSYAHSDFAACFGPASVAAQRSRATFQAQPVQAARTWTLRQDSWHANFCAQQGAGAVSGFLSPYNVDTLHSAARDITRCSKLGLCPSTSFHVRGSQVESRRVLVHTLSEDSPDGVTAATEARDYCALDAQRCWGMGHLLGADCAEVDAERSALCVVDALVLPLLPVVYGTSKLRTASEFSAQLLLLRSHCPRAFKESFDSRADVSLFEHVFVHLTQPYAWTDTARRQRVLEYSNALFLFVFGARGFTSVEHYLEHSRCAVFIASALNANQQRFAEKAQLGLVFYHSSLVGSPSEPALPVLPGASLYLIDRRLPISINLRWLMQCVVLSKDTVEGGVAQSFLAELNSGALAARTDTVDCGNYRHDTRATDSMPLASWLRKARYLFTQLDSAELNPVQISQDIDSSIRQSLAQLPVFDMPDLLCVASEKGWLQATGQSVFGMQNALEHLERFRNPALAFGVNAQETTLASTQQLFTDAGSTSIYTQVLQYLVKDTKRSAAAWESQSAVTLEQLVEDGVLENMHILEKLVLPKDMYPRFEYVNLKKLPLLYDSTLQAVSLETYTSDDAGQLCRCSDAQLREPAELCNNRRRLLKPEYSLSSKVRCAGLRVLPCDAQGVTRLLDRRSSMRTPFLSQDELLYLVLLVFQYEISYTASGGFTTLHRIRDPEQALSVDELYAVALPRNASRLSLHEAQLFNDYLEQHDAASIKCPPTDLDFFQETNQRHRQLRQCRDSLRESIGWSLPRGHVLVVRPPRDPLMTGFYLAHLERPRTTFLDTLFNTDWTDAEHTSYDVAICNTRPEQTSVMAPFWAEYFDVASGDTSDEPSLACDIESSSAGSILMVYDTLCSSSGTGTISRQCSDHPNYKTHLDNSMSAACARSDGKVVVRRHIGALQQGKGKLCDLKPEHMDQTCALKHGALDGHTGDHATDLDQVLPVLAENIQRGLWDPANDIFRGRQSGANLLTAMALNKDDIAGHCLGFSISSQGILTLRSAALSSHCEASNAAMSDTAVRKWLADVVQEWAWDHAHTSAIHAQEGPAQEAQGSVAWTCPLHWHQQYHDDGGRHQARSPSWQRNSARFHHITGANHYAHPTVRHANRLRGIRAARFLGDGVACVAAPELCHSVAYLNTTIRDILQPAWRTVSFVPERHPECNRTLDWPADCGKASPDTPHVGACVLRS